MIKEFVTIFGSFTMAANDFRVVFNIAEDNAKKLSPCLAELRKRLSKVVPHIASVDINGNYLKVRFDLDRAALRLIANERPDYKSDLAEHLRVEMNALLAELIG